MNAPTRIDPSTLSRKDRFYMGLLHFFSRLPLPFLQRLGAAIGWLAGRFQGNSAYKVVRRNFELCFPDESPEWHDRMTRQNLIDTAPVAFEFAKTWGMPPAYSISQIRTVHGEDVFFEAIRNGKGTIAIIPHFGSWEFMNAWTNQHTAPTIMYKPGKDKGVDAVVLEARSRLDAELVPADDSGVRSLLKALKRGGFVAILPDHVPSDNGGVYAPFFGISTWTAVIVARLAARTGSNVLVMSAIRRPKGDGFDMWFDRPDPEIFNEDLPAATAAMNRTIETLIRRAPTHYHWFYKRFKKNENMPDPYKR